MVSDDERYEHETMDHIRAVRSWIGIAQANLEDRYHAHDQSKLREPERSGFQAITERLKDLTYGSEEYRAALREQKPTIAHHYAENDHHPEHFENGVSGMSLMALLEMLCDWKAATGRMKDGDLGASLTHNKERFGIDNQLQSVLENTARELGMLK